MTKVVFMGTPDFSVPVLNQLVEDGYEVVGVVTQPDKPIGRKRIITPPPVKQKAIELGLRCLQPEKIRTEYEEILALNPDLIVTAAYGQILPKEILESPNLGCINVHASLLPKYRGGAPIHQAIIDGEKETGITIMYMVEKLDAGDILTQVVVPISEEDNVGTLHNKLSAAGAGLLSNTIPKLIAGEITPVPQNDAFATFASNISRDQEEIIWSRQGEVIYNQIRGLHPWPVAYTKFKGNNLKIWWGEKVNTKYNANPGTIIDLRRHGFVVSTGNETSILITDLQPAGKKRMKAEQFLSGSQVKIGDKLGE
jgi:methionyl-tRNA formyltransferase